MMISYQPLLSICIPIYNRLPFLERMLCRFSEDKRLFENDIELIISDNCSEEDLQGCIKRHQENGLHLHYYRQSTNIGSDGNFKTLFGMASGKYFWLLGSDDIPVSGFLPLLIEKLRDTNYGLFHINCYHPSSQGELVIYEDNHNEFIQRISYWITFQSSSIFRTTAIKKVHFKRYERSWLIQVPVFLTSSCSFPQNAYFSFSCFEAETDNRNNGGYNLFEVFVSNLFSIYRDFQDMHLIDQRTVNWIKRDEYIHFLMNYIVSLLIERKKTTFKTSGAIRILLKHYGKCPYAYYYLIKSIMRIFKH